MDGWTIWAGEMKADRVITLGAGKEIYGGIKVALCYKAIV